MAFFSENRRRNMLKAGTVYLFGTGTTLKLLDMMLPFVNMSSDEEQEFFSDGLSEELDRACRQRLPPPAGRLSSLV